MGGPQALEFFNLQRIQRDHMLILLALGLSVLILLAPGLPASPEQLTELV